VAQQWDISRYLSLYVGEATEHLEALSKDLVHLEQGVSLELIDSLFRHAHSIKGMAGSMGFEATTTLAHCLEDLLGVLREQPERFEKSLGDLILATVDTLQQQVRCVATSQPIPEAIELARRLAAASKSVSLGTAVAQPEPNTALPDARRGSDPAYGATTIGPSPAAAQPLAANTEAASPASAGASTDALPSSAPPSSPSGLSESPLPPRYSITLRVSATSTQPGVRGFLAIKRLSTLGNTFNLEPPLEDIKLGRLPRGVISLELETDARESDIGKTLRTVTDIELDHIRTVARTVSIQPLVPAKPAVETPRVIGQEPARTVRIRAELLDDFLDTAGELMLGTARVREMGRAIPEAFRGLLDESVDRLSKLVKGFHGKVMKARMTPVGVITDRLPRAARDIARRRGREIDLIIEGADIELDRAIVDELNDPILHLLRNAIDHGIEPPEERRMRGKSPKGTVRLTIKRVRDRVEIEMRDDGRGMDVDRLKTLAIERGLITLEQARTMSEREAMLLSCLPGISTAASITDISGRGVGMDAVKRVVDSVAGHLEIETARSKGTTLRLSMPLTVATAHLLLVSVGQEIYGLPITKVAGVVECTKEALSHSQNLPMLQHGQSVVPVHDLSTLLDVRVKPSVDGSVLPFVVVEAEAGKIALCVERLLGQEEVVLKSLVRPLDLVPGLAGVTILGTGQPVFILDVARLEGQSHDVRGADA
jgi:two-component system chemotaxis sensor kinase CheA